MPTIVQCSVAELRKEHWTKSKKTHIAYDRIWNYRMKSGKLNILFVIPRYETYGMANHYVMPMGILYVSAYIKKKGIANVFTLNLNHIKGEEATLLADAIKRNEIDLFAIGGLSGEYRDISRMSKLARDISQDVKIVIGGGIITADPIVAMRAFPEANLGVIGEGEKTVADLLDAICNHRDLSKVNGLIYREGCHLHITNRRDEIKDLDSLPIPDYEGFNYREYLNTNPDLSDEGKKYSQVSVIGGRSCKYNCTFCFHPSGTTYRQRSLDSIFQEIDYLVEHYDISYIALREELFATDNQRVAEFCQRVKKYDFDWSIQLRIDSINQGLVNLLKGSRCRYIFVGIESASDIVLKSMHKGIDLKQIEYALELLYQAGLHSRSGVIFGDSVETFETAMFTLNWYKKNKGRYRLFVDMIISFPGSTLYKRACRTGIIPDPVQFLKDGCPIINVSQMNDAEFASLVTQIENINGRNYNVKYYVRHL